MFLRTLWSLILAAAGTLFLAPGASAQTVYDITHAELSGWSASGCCSEANYLVANGLNDLLTATFTDTVGGGAVPSVTVQVAIRHACNPDSLVFSFNGQQIGTWGSVEGPHCNCGDSSIAVASFTLPNPNTYNFNGANTVSVLHTSDGTCHEAIGQNPAWGQGVAFRVTVSRDAAVPTLPWPALAFLALVLGAGGFVALRRATA